MPQAHRNSVTGRPSLRTNSECNPVRRRPDTLRFPRPSRAIPAVSALLFSANLLCSGLCGLEARNARPLGPQGQASATSPVDSNTQSCLHHRPRGEKQDSTPGHSRPHDDAACPGCNWSAEPTQKVLQAAALPLPAQYVSQYLQVAPPVVSPAMAIRLSASRERPPGAPLFLVLNVIRI